MSSHEVGPSRNEQEPEETWDWGRLQTHCIIPVHAEYIDHALPDSFSPCRTANYLLRKADQR